MPGTYTRFTAEADWRRSFTDSAGEIWTPFASLRADAINADISNQPGVSNFLPVGDTQALRVMPTVGLEYRYPFINVQPWGTTTIEPIAQVIIRPNESYAGKLPNEDSQSMTFDTSNLFSVDKFSGYDRVEGGGRANVGAQATTQFDRGGSVTAMFGQSYQLFGLNSFAVADVTNTAVDSGLQTPEIRLRRQPRLFAQPDLYLQHPRALRPGDRKSSASRLRASAAFDRWSVSVMYGDYAPQPDLGYLVRREGILSADRSRSPRTGWRQELRAGTLSRTRSTNTSSAPAMWMIASCWRPITSRPIPTPRPHRRPYLATLSCCSSACGLSPKPPRSRIGAGLTPRGPIRGPAALRIG
jgi:LPS-assembly protein